LRQARQELVSGQLDQAAARYQQVLDDSPRDPEGLLGMARVALAKGTIDEARERIEQVLDDRPDDLDAQILHAVAVEAAGDRPAALAAVRALADERRGDCLAAYHAGRMLAASGEGEQALAYLGRAAALEDRAAQRYEIQNLIGYVHQELGQLGEALQAHRRAVHIYPKRLEAYLGLAEALQRGGDLDAALTLLGEARRGAGENAALWQKQAELHVAKGDFPAALHSAKRVCELEPDSAPAWLDVAGLGMMTRQWDTAEQAARQAQRLAPAAWQPHFRLGLVFDATGRRDEAESAYRAALEHAPDSWEPANNLGLVILSRSGPQAATAAEPLFRQAVKLAGTDVPEPRLNLAMALSRQDKTTECLAICDELLGGDLSDPLRERVTELRRDCAAG
jgi:tetratricopeptide (TPR) repeat protein